MLKSNRGKHPFGRGTILYLLRSHGNIGDIWVWKRNLIGYPTEWYILKQLDPISKEDVTKQLRHRVMYVYVEKK